MIDLTQIAQALIALLSVIITVILIPFIRRKASMAQQAQIQSWINVAVYAASQIFNTAGVGSEKKEYVLEFLQAQGITYDATAIDAMIEASVKKLNIQQEAAASVASVASTVAGSEAETIVVKLPSK